MTVESTAPDATVRDELDPQAALAALKLDAAALDRELGAAEATRLPEGLWDPPPGWEQRLEARVAQRLRDREAAWMLASLAGLAWPTLRAVVGDESGDTT